MYSGFPPELLDLVRCGDGGALRPSPDTRPGPTLWNVDVHCATCGRTYQVRDGILRLLDAAQLDAESAHERQRREEQYAAYSETAEAGDLLRAESDPTLDALEPLPRSTVLELGAGAGRFTVRMAQRDATVVAVDFSIEALRVLSGRIREGWRVGLVQADCTTLVTPRGAFDRVLSTLISNLPTHDRRVAMLRVAARALSPTGVFAFTAHYFGLYSRLQRREPQTGRYSEGGIYRYLFRRRELAALTRTLFADVRCHPVQVVLPLAWRLRMPILATSRLAERVPLLRAFGWLLLVVAHGPGGEEL